MSVEKNIKESFKRTGIKEFDVIKERIYPYYVIQFYCRLNCEELDKISQWIKSNFSREGYYSHLVYAKLGMRDGYMSLVIDGNEAEMLFTNDKRIKLPLNFK